MTGIYKYSAENRIVNNCSYMYTPFEGRESFEFFFPSRKNFLTQAGESIEAIINYKFNHLGIMWHPEREKPFRDSDIKLVRAFFNGDNKN